MTPARWQQLKPLFFEALDLPAGERAAFLARACQDDPSLRAELEALLRAEADTPALLDAGPEALAAFVAEATEADPNIDRRIGAYRVLRELGHGGMGTVYLAERHDGTFRQYVAMKVIRRGMDTAQVIRRFQVERQILAALSHPNIARLLDGGTTDDGVSYFVMEYVDGQPITDYCDSRRLGIEERLKLFRTVCEAVHYAHQNLIVHRDLKPSNILVSPRGEVKLLDFGIAKLLNPNLAPQGVAMTRTGVRVMTPEYASPEQVRGEPITTASDVYALGVVLYELLTGRRPYHLAGRAQDEVHRVICEEEPTRPSTVVSQVDAAATPKAISEARSTAVDRLRRRLHGDLDNVVLKAMRKEPQRRYASAEQFGEDLRRHLAGEPVMARKPTLGYRANKFVHRHRFGVATTSAFLVLLIGFGALYAVQLRQERDRARQAAAQAEQVTDFMVGVFESSDPYEAPGDTVTARVLLEQGVQRVEAELAGQPVVQARLLHIMGRVYRNLGRADLGIPLLRRSLALREETLERPHAEIAESMVDLGHTLSNQGDYEVAESLLVGALAMRRTLYGPAHADVAQALRDLGSLYSRKGDRERAERLFRESLDLYRSLLGDDHVQIANTRNNLALVLWNRGAYDEAEQQQRQALALFRKHHGAYHPNVVTSVSNLALILADQGNLSDAEAMIRTEVLPLERRLMGPAHPGVANTLNNLATILRDLGDDEAAEPYQQEALALYRQAYGADHAYTAIGLYNLAEIKRNRDQAATADTLYRQSLAVAEAVLDADHPLISHNLVGLGRLHLARGEAAVAQPLLRRALAIRQAAYVDAHYRIADAQSLLGDCLTRLQRYDEAEPLLIEGHNGLVDLRGATHHLTQSARRRLVALYEAWGRPEQAALYRTAAGS